MGLFDNKKTKEEKRIYQGLLQIKENSYQLKYTLPTNLKDFLNFYDKERLIMTYKYTQEVMKRDDITQAFDLKNFATCYDFVAPYYIQYVFKTGSAQHKSQLIENDFMSFLETNISNKLSEYKIKENINKNQQQREKMTSDIEGRLQMLYDSPVQKKIDELAYQGADRLFRDIEKQKFDEKQSEFDKKFPQYKKLCSAKFLLDAGIDTKNPIVTEINNCIKLGKERNGITDLEFDDFLVPYLDEKFKIGILTKSEEKIYYKRATDNNQMEAKRREFCLYANSLIFYNTVEERMNFINSFEECNKIIEVLYNNSNGMKR